MKTTTTEYTFAWRNHHGGWTLSGISATTVEQIIENAEMVCGESDFKIMKVVKTTTTTTTTVRVPARDR